MIGSIVSLFSEIGVVAGALVALFTALIIAIRKVHELGEWIHNVNEVVTKELTRNHGSSMKDQVHTIGRKLDLAKEELAHLQRTVDDHVGDVEAHASDPAAHVRPTGPDDGHAGPR